VVRQKLERIWVWRGLSLDEDGTATAGGVASRAGEGAPSLLGRWETRPRARGGGGRAAGGTDVYLPGGGWSETEASCGRRCGSSGFR